MTCEVCGKAFAEKHHVIYRSQGGLDIKVNFTWLCEEHHRGNSSPHKNRKIDLVYKRQVQEKLFDMFSKKEVYQIKEIAEIIGYDRNRLEKKFKSVPCRAGEYAVEDIVRKLCGGKLY